MFGPLGVPEMLFILVLALLVFGPRRLPELGRTIGRAMGEFRRATTDLRRTFNNELALEDETPRRPAPAPPPRPRAVADGSAPKTEPARAAEPRSAAPQRATPVPATPEPATSETAMPEPPPDPVEPN